MTTDAAIISTDHPDAVTYRRAADAFRAEDLDTLATTIHQDVIWHLPGTTWMARDFEGRGTLLAYLREIMERTNGTFKLQDVFVSGSDDHVLAVQRFGATVDDEERFFDASSVMRFSRGKPVSTPDGHGSDCLTPVHPTHEFGRGPADHRLCGTPRHVRRAAVRAF